MAAWLNKSFSMVTNIPHSKVTSTQPHDNSHIKTVLYFIIFLPHHYSHIKIFQLSSVQGEEKGSQSANTGASGSISTIHHFRSAGSQSPSSNAGLPAPSVAHYYGYTTMLAY